jgi:hypothetical protein
MKIVNTILLLSTHLSVLPHSVLDSNFPCSSDPQSSLAANKLVSDSFDPRSPYLAHPLHSSPTPESPSLVLVINDTKLLMSYVKWFELDISSTCDEGACGME